MAPQRSTLYSTPEVFGSIARRIGHDSEGPIMLLGIGNRGKRFLNYFSHALEDCEVPHVAYLLQQDGYVEDDGDKRGYRRVVDAVQHTTEATYKGSQKPGNAVIIDDLIDTFKQGAGANFYVLGNRNGSLEFTGDLFTVVHYDFMGVAHLSLDLNDKNRVLVGDRDRMIARMREVGPIRFSELQQTGAIRHIGHVDRLVEIPEDDKQEPYLERVRRISHALMQRLGLKTLETSRKPPKADLRTYEDFVAQIMSGE